MVRGTTTRAPGLAGVRVLLVEDEFLILLELEALLTAAGARVAAACRSAAEALATIDDGGGIDLALLDYRLGDGTVTPVARRLHAAGTPFVFYTGQSREEVLLDDWRDALLVQKPAAPAAIIAALERAWDQRPRQRAT